MSRFYMSLKEAPKVRIEFTDDIEDAVKPAMIELFGMQFLSSEQRQGDLLKYEFESTESNIEDAIDALAELNSRHVVKSIDIDLSMN